MLIILRPLRLLIWIAAFGVIGIMMIHRGRADHLTNMIVVGSGFVLFATCVFLWMVRGIWRAVKDFGW